MLVAVVLGLVKVLVSFASPIVLDEVTRRFEEYAGVLAERVVVHSELFQLATFDEILKQKGEHSVF